MAYVCPLLDIDFSQFAPILYLVIQKDLCVLGFERRIFILAVQLSNRSATTIIR